MQRHISEQQWLEYLDGAADKAAEAEIERHLHDCSDCTRTYSELAGWQQALTSTGARLRESTALSENDIERMLADSLDRLRVRPAWTPSEAVMLLNFLLSPICGAGAARAAT